MQMGINNKCRVEKEHNNSTYIENKNKLIKNSSKVYQIFRKNRQTIAFFLINCIFEKDLK
jgi:hypothetical protein